MNLYTQIIGLIGFTIIAFSYWQKSKTTILYLQIISYLIYACHYYLLGSMSAFVMNLVSIIGFLVICFKDKYIKKNTLPLLIITGFIYVITWSFSYQNIMSILPLIACLLPLIVLWQHNHLYIRAGGLIGTIIWIIYNLYVGSYAGLTTNIFFLISTSLAIYKLDIMRENRSKNINNKMILEE